MNAVRWVVDAAVEFIMPTVFLPQQALRAAFPVIAAIS